MQYQKRSSVGSHFVFPQKGMCIFFQAPTKLSVEMRYGVTFFHRYNFPNFTNFPSHQMKTKHQVKNTKSHSFTVPPNYLGTPKTTIKVNIYTM